MAAGILFILFGVLIVRRAFVEPRPAAVPAAPAPQLMPQSDVASATHVSSQSVLQHAAFVAQTSVTLWPSSSNLLASTILRILMYP